MTQKPWQTLPPVVPEVALDVVPAPPVPPDELVLEQAPAATAIAVAESETPPTRTRERTTRRKCGVEETSPGMGPPFAERKRTPPS
jgi:hypothetical protein